jgi:hypothetical protein
MLASTGVVGAVMGVAFTVGSQSPVRTIAALIL